MTTKGYYGKPDAVGERIHCERCRTWIALFGDDGVVRRDGRPTREMYNIDRDLLVQLIAEHGWTKLGQEMNRYRNAPDIPFAYTIVRCRQCRLIHWIDAAWGNIVHAEPETPELGEQLATMRKRPPVDKE